MAASYALPLAMANDAAQTHTHGHHVHSHSLSGTQLAPSKSFNGTYLSNGNHIKKAFSNGSLYTHAEAQSPLSPPVESPFAHKENEHVHSLHPHGHGHSHSYTPSLPMRGRTRGESDLGRPAGQISNGYGLSHNHTHVHAPPSVPKSWFSLPEALTGLLIPLPYLLASAAYSSSPSFSLGSFPPLSAYARYPKAVLEEANTSQPDIALRSSSLIEACTLASGTLLLVGILAKIRLFERVLDRRKGPASIHIHPQSLLNAVSARKMVTRALSIGLPYYAALQIGGLRTGLILLTTVAGDLTCSDSRLHNHGVLANWKHLLSTRIATFLVLLLCILGDTLGITIFTSTPNLVLGYAALACSAFALQPPLPSLATPAGSRPASKASSPDRSTPWRMSAPPRLGQSSAASPLICSPQDSNITLCAGVLLSLITVLVSISLSANPSVSPTAIILSTLSMASTTALVFLSQPSALRSRRKAGLALGCLLTASSAFLFSPTVLVGTVANGALAALAYIAVLYDTSSSAGATYDHDQHDLVHTGRRQHKHEHTESKGSWITRMLLARCEPGSIMHGILSEKDSRRIAYFTCLNFAYMLVQGFYGWVSGSLGLLSDTVHMFFDCLGLVVGLGAAVASKWPTSVQKPYGWGKLNTLAGFGNGIFLMLVSVEFVWEAIEGIME
ncbi:putative zinc transporter msc2, partial [Elasticomyces elasticus]